MLYQDMMEDFHFLDKTRLPDGEGGIITTWTEGAAFTAYAAFDSSIEARTGAAAGVSSLYKVTAPVDVHLEYHDVIRRARDGKILRVTSDGDDVITPAMSTMSFLQVTAEEWEVTVTPTQAQSGQNTQSGQTGGGGNG